MFIRFKSIALPYILAYRPGSTGITPYLL
jgi:hypothetical protein